MVAFDFPASLDIDKLINEVKIDQIYNKEKNITELAISFPPWLYKDYAKKKIETSPDFHRHFAEVPRT